MTRSPLEKGCGAGLLVLGVMLVSACTETPNSSVQKSDEKPSPSAAVEESLPAQAIQPTALGQPSYREESFELTFTGPEKAQVGEEVEFVVRLSARGGFKVNQDYPIKFSFASSEAFTPSVPVLRKEQGHVDKAQAELKGAGKWRLAGEQRVSGTLSFSVCTEEQCLIEKRELSAVLSGS